ncbi:MAG: hypothetical protein U0105_00285 [Candidatus Obscuribacterales bacterium]|jgi:hypothetical protein
MKRFSFALTLIALMGILPAANADSLKGPLEGSVSEDGMSLNFWLNSPVGSDDRGRYLRFVTDDRLHRDNVGLRNRDFENFSSDTFTASASANMGTKTRGIARAARESQTHRTTANRAIYITGPWF